MAEDLIHMGTIRRPHGVRGEVALDWHGDRPFSPDMPFILDLGETRRPIRLIEARTHHGSILIGIDGISDRDHAEELRGGRLMLPRTSLPLPEKDEIYVADLPGFMVCTADGTEIGRLESVDYPAGKAVWSIRTADDQEILFPAEPCFIQSFDSARKIVHINPPPGLLDVYLA